MESNAIPKFLSILLVLVLLLTPIAPVVATGEAPVSLVPALMTGNTVSLAMQIDSSWEGYFNGTIILTNTGEKPIENWALSFAFPHAITNIWNGVIYEQADGLYTVKNAGWNQDIPVGGSVSFGFTAQQNGEALMPDFFFINTAQRTLPSTDYEATYKLKKDWGTGFSGEITLKNISSQTIEDWSFSMDFARTITTASNTIFTTEEETQYLLNNPGYDQNINTGKNIKFSIQGTGGVETDVPSNFLVSQVTVGVSLTGDYDADGVKDYEELVIYGTDPLIDDSNTDPEDPEDPDLITDTDGDGIPNYYETELGTDPLLIDTDGDGIDDMTEIICGFDPLISDLDEDFDGDGLTLQQEQELGTEFWNEDTDFDGLLDGEELNTYGTNPLLEDTDGDGLLDGDEIAISLDPVNASTNGIPDNEYTEEYAFASDSPMLEKINTPENPYALSIVINAAGNVLGNLAAAESPYSKTMENEAILGSIPELSYDTNMSIESFTIRFKIQDSLIPNPDSAYAAVNPELSGITRYNIFHYDEDLDMLFPVETQYDEENQTVYAETDVLGTYCVMDVEVWLEGIGIMPEDIAIDAAVSGTSNLSSDELSVSFLGTATPADTADGKITFLTTNTTLSNFGSVSLLSAEDVVAEGSYEGHKYAIIDKSLSWSEAEAYCEYMAGHLVTITSQEEQDYVNLLVLEGSKNLYWLGAKEYYGDMKWVTGEISSFSNWSAGEPNSESEVFVHMYRNSYMDSILGTWNDTIEYYEGTAFHCTSNCGMVCEWETPVKIVYGTSLLTCNIASTISNISDEDADGDEIPNWQEVNSNLDFGFFNIDGTYIPESYANIIAMYHPSTFFTRYNINPLFISVIPIKSNPEKKDEDEDGLWDGAAQYVGSEMIAPKDPHPKTPDGPVGIWQAQIEMEESGNIPSSLADHVESDYSEWEYGQWPKAVVGLGGEAALNFRYDTLMMALHAQVETWQKNGGYNDLYDQVFSLGTGGNMRSEKFEFADNGEEFVVWVWRGWYYQLESGAEIGIYTNPHEIKVGDVVLIKKHWDAIDFEIPMTINLYNVYGENNVQNVFSWAPIEDQWWITGFNPEFTSPDKEKMAVIGKLDFSGRKPYYDKLMEAVSVRKDLQDFMIFDEDGHTVWLIWWEK